MKLSIHLATLARRWCLPGSMLAMAMLLVPLGVARAEPQDGQKFDDWTVRCNDERDAPTGGKCFIFQSVVETDQERTVMMFVIGKPPNQAEPRAVIVVPLGIDLRPGIEMVVDEGEPRRYPFVVCFPDGCQAHINVDEELMGAFKRGLKGIVKFRALPGGQGVKIPFSLKGFTAGLDALS